MVVQEPLGHGAVERPTPAVEHDDAVADPLDRRRVVRHEHERRALLHLLGDPVQALALERLVADGEDLVDQQDVGVQVRDDREPEPQEHPRAVRLHRHVDELAQLGELDDAVDALLDVLAPKPCSAPFSQMFSRPVKSSPNPAPNSSSATTRPPHSARPESSGTMPARQRRSDVLPAPLRPTIPTASPGAT